MARVCTGGNAEDMGETCVVPFESSSTDECRCDGAVVLGVGGTFPVDDDTLPMNHD